MTLAACSSGKAGPDAPPTDTPSSTTSSTFTPLPVAAGIAPLTGLPVTDAAALTRPALIVKIDNVPPARPQAGLNEADLVIETPVEGGLTRLFTVFHSMDASMIGPIRSARPVDTSLLRMLSGGVFAFSGGVAGTINDIKSNSGAAVVYADVSPKYFKERKDRRKGHEVFGDSKTLLTVGLERKPELTVPKSLFTYSTTKPNGTPASSVELHFPATRCKWSWSGESWLREQEGTRDMLEDGSQANAANVVVLSVALTMTDGRDAAGSAVPLPGVIGTGTAWVLRDGVMVQGTWTRQGDGQPFVLRDLSGKVIDLSAGRTWIELLPKPREPKLTS